MRPAAVLDPLDAVPELPDSLAESLGQFGQAFGNKGEQSDNKYENQMRWVWGRSLPIRNSVAVVALTGMGLSGAIGMHALGI